MNASERFDRDFADLLADLAQPQLPDYFDEALQLAVSHRQRPAWTFPERWIPMGVLTRRLPLVPALPSRTMGLLVMLLLLLLATVVIGVGALLLQQQQRPAPPFGLAANGVIAYSNEGNIYSYDPATGEVQLIVGGPELDVGPWFSRDGTQVIFVRVLEIEPQEVIAVMIAEANGGNLRTLVEPEVSGEVHWSELSPDGRLFAIANSAEGAPRLSVVNVATGARTAIEVPVEAELFEWLPDSSEIVFRGIDGEPAFYAVRPDGTEFRQLTDPIPGDNYLTRFQISHDGRYLGYNARVGGAHVLYLFDMLTGENRVIFPPARGSTGHPVFSTDSQKVAYVRYSPGEAQVVVAPLDSAPDGAVDVGPSMPVGALQLGLTAQFSPDSKNLLITADDGEVWLADLESGTHEPLELPRDELDLAWQRRAP